MTVVNASTSYCYSILLTVLLHTPSCHNTPPLIHSNVSHTQKLHIHVWRCFFIHRSVSGRPSLS